MMGDAMGAKASWDIASPWEGLHDGYPKGETHEVAGHWVPIGVDEVLLETLGSCRILDANGEDPTDGEGIPPLPADEVAGLIEAATARNNERDDVVSYSAVANIVAMARIYRFDHRNVCEMLLRHAEEGRLPVLMMAEGEEAIAKMCRRLDDPKAWSVWEVASGEWLDLSLVDDGGRERTVVDGGPYILTGKGERRVGTREGVIPMWALVADCDGTDPYDCEDFFRNVTFGALVDEDLVWDAFDEDFWHAPVER